MRNKGWAIIYCSCAVSPCHIELGGFIGKQQGRKAREKCGASIQKDCDYSERAATTAKELRLRLEAPQIGVAAERESGRRIFLSLARREAHR